MSDQASTIMVNTLEPQSGTTLTVGKSGQNLQVNADSLKANVAKDAGGNALFTSDGSGNLSGLNSGLGSAMVLISTQTASDSASLSFTSGIDSTYNEYLFEFFNINPATDLANFTFQVSTNGGSSYGIAITGTYFRAKHNEANTETGLAYDTGADAAQSTSYISLGEGLGNESDENTAGEFHLYNPASTTYIKNYYSEFATGEFSPGEYNTFVGGYANTTSAVDAISFKMSSGNFDGIIKMYGIK